MPVAFLCYEVEGEIQEGKRCAIVTSTLCGQKVAEMSGDMLIGIFTTDNSSSENRISGGQASSNGQG